MLRISASCPSGLLQCVGHGCSGPATRVFAIEEDLSEMEFVTVVVGDELANITQQKGYCGEDTIAYRSTKVLNARPFVFFVSAY